jgi:ABC-type proline/glycine betaine transport system ATPase subunit
MSNNKDSKLYNQTSIKIFKEYQIQLSIILDSINIEIQKKDSYNIYDSKFNIEYLHQQKLLMPNLTLGEMIEFINALIDLKKYSN